ncbi:hypothetical protein [Aeromicrobium sp. NPDC092404]|uniref:hypothetical protein n=1 Tax=Aeromicrobium sp. NPDC092404 TaxID=3154976 RepID=UPI00342FCBCE
MSPTALPSSARICVYRGRELEEIIAGPDFVTVHDDGLDAPDAIDRGDSGKGPWVRLPTSSCDRRYRRDVTAVWDGQQVYVVGTHGSSAAITFQGDPQWARDHGLSGSQHESWGGSAPLDELTGVTVRERDLA